MLNQQYYYNNGKPVAIEDLHLVSREGSRGGRAKYWLQVVGQPRIQVFSFAQMNKKTTYYDVEGNEVITAPLSDNRLSHEGNSGNSCKHWLQMADQLPLQVFTEPQLNQKTTYYDIDGTEVITLPLSDYRLTHAGGGNSKHWLQMTEQQPPVQVFTKGQLNQKTTYYNAEGNEVITVPVSDHRVIHEGAGGSAKHWVKEADQPLLQVFTKAQINQKTTYYDAQGNEVITLPLADCRLSHEGNHNNIKYWLHIIGQLPIQVFAQNNKKRKRPAEEIAPAQNKMIKPYIATSSSPAEIGYEEEPHVIDDPYDAVIKPEDILHSEIYWLDSPLFPKINDTSSNLSCRKLVATSSMEEEKDITDNYDDTFYTPSSFSESPFVLFSSPSSQLIAVEHLMYEEDSFHSTPNSRTL